MLKGVIVNRPRAQQIRDFSGLRFGNITPTDIDCFIEYQNMLYIIAESKSGVKELPFGQKLALERMTDSLNKDKPTILFVGHHNYESSQDVPFDLIPVTEYYFRGHWHIPEEKILMRRAFDLFIEKRGKDF